MDDLNPLTIQIFTKAPSLVEVKTRLSPCLTKLERNSLYTHLLEHTVDTASQLQTNTVELWCYPSCDDPTIENIRNKYSPATNIQQGADLGERMIHSLNRALAQQHLPVLIGSDCPFIDSSYINDAHSYLKQTQASVVLGKANDGGFVLIASNTVLHLSLFEGIKWGTDSVLDAATKRITESGLQCIHLPSLSDIDRPEDLELLRDTDLYPLNS